MRCDELYPSLRGRVAVSYRDLADVAADTSDVMFVALPSGHAMSLMGVIDTTATRVIDLGGDFRLHDAALYEQYYGRAHASPSLLGAVPYGLSEWNRDAIREAALVANPGCYPTSILLSLLPLVRDGVVELERITATSISGASGAGRSASVELSYTELHGNMRAYRVGEHQHTPEIMTMLATFGGRSASVTFVPHLAPIARGIYSTITARLAPSITSADIAHSFDAAYRGEPFIRWSDSLIPELGAVVGTNYADIGYRIDPASGELVLMSTIDNLIKGAAGQAIQNMNIMFGFKETEGLL